MTILNEVKSGRVPTGVHTPASAFGGVFEDGMRDRMALGGVVFD